MCTGLEVFTESTGFCLDKVILGPAEHCSVCEANNLGSVPG